MYVVTRPLGALAPAVTATRTAVPLRAAVPTRAAALSSVAQKKEIVRQNRAAIQQAINKAVPGKVTINADGSLHLVNPLTGMDAAMSKLMRDMGGWAVVDASPLPSDLKTKLKNRPATFFIDLFDPFLDAIAGALVEVMEAGLDRNSADFKARTTKDLGIMRGSRGGFVYDLSTPPFIFTLGDPKFKEVNIWLYPESDELFDEESRGIILRIRSLFAYFVLFFRKPIELQAAMIRAGLDMLFPEDVVLVRTTGTDLNKPQEPHVVDRLPDNPAATRHAVIAGRQVYVQTKQNPTTKQMESRYYTLSPKGLYDRAVEMRRQWDAKYEAYKNDKITNLAGVALYGPRMTFLRSQGKTEAQARNIIATEDNFPKQFAETRNLPMQFRVVGHPALGGGVAEVVNGPRPSDTFINRLKAEYEADLAARVRAAEALSGSYVHAEGLGADPGTTAGAGGATKTAADAGTAGGGGQAGTLIFGLTIKEWGAVAAIVSGAIATIIKTTGEAIAKVEEAKRPAPSPVPADDQTISPTGVEPSGGQTTTGPGGGTTTEEAGFPVVPVALAAGLALLFLSRR